jgi:hypothetical protein
MKTEQQGNSSSNHCNNQIHTESNSNSVSVIGSSHNILRLAQGAQKILGGSMMVGGTSGTLTGLAFLGMGFITFSGSLLLGIGSAVSSNIADIQQQAHPLAQHLLDLAGNGVMLGLTTMGASGVIVAASQVINVMGGLVADKTDNLYMGQQLLKGKNEKLFTAGIDDGDESITEGTTIIKNDIQARIASLRQTSDNHKNKENKPKQ